MGKGSPKKHCPCCVIEQLELRYLLTTIFSDDFSGSYPGSWSIGHDPAGGGSYAWAWPSGYADEYSNPSGLNYYYPNNLHVYMERRGVSLAGYNTANLSFSYDVYTSYGDFLSVNLRDQSGNWHELWKTTYGIEWGTRTLDLGAYVNQTNLYVQFRFDSDGSGSGSPYFGAHIDDVSLTAAAVSDLPPNDPTFISVPIPAKLYPYTYSNSPDDTNGPYTVTVDYTDPDGAANLKNTYLRLSGSGAPQTIMYYNLTTAQQWIGEGDNLFNITASKSSITNGYRIIYSFQIKNSWTPSTNVDLEAWSLDKANAESAHRTYDWTGTYDNGLVIAQVRKTDWVDNDGDGYYSAITVQADANTSVSSRLVDLVLYQRDSAAANAGGFVWDSGYFVTFGSSVDWRGPVVTVNSRATYDFTWELYDPSWYITNRWYDVDPEISNINMEPAAQDVPFSYLGTIDFPSPGNLTWTKVNSGFYAGLSSNNVYLSAGDLVLRTDANTGIGSQVEHDGHSFGYYSATIKAAPGSLDPAGVCHGFFYYLSDTEEIDAEILTAKLGYVYFTVQGGETFRVPVPYQSSQYHEYGFDWKSASVTFYLDGRIAIGDRVVAGGSTQPDTVLQTGIQAVAWTNIPQRPGKLILNSWSGNNWAGWAPATQREMRVKAVSFAHSLIGDLNSDGSVSISDFITLASNFNQTGKTWADGDLNGDGAVTISDFIDLAAHFNQSLAAASAAPIDTPGVPLATSGMMLDEPLLVSADSLAMVRPNHRSRRMHRHHQMHRGRIHPPANLMLPGRRY